MNPEVQEPSTFDINTDIPDLAGKAIFVTGGTAGLGSTFLTTLAAAKPAALYLTGRNASAASEISKEITRLSPVTEIKFIALNMASLKSIHSAMLPLVDTSSSERIQRVDILLLNAGIMANPGVSAWSEDGFQSHFAINHLGNALIMHMLMPTMLDTAKLPDADVRIVSTTSLGWRAHPSGGVQYEKLRRPTSQSVAESDDTIGAGRHFIRDVQHYGQSKIANIWTAAEVARQYGDRGITAVSVHPGVVRTSLVSGLGSTWKWITYIGNFGRVVSQEEGVRNQVWAAVGAGKNQSSKNGTKKVWGILENGAWYLPVGKKGDLGKVGSDRVLAERLWEWTEELFKENGML